MGRKVILILAVVGIFVMPGQGNATLILVADHTFNGSNPSGPASWLKATFNNSGTDSVTLTLSASGLQGGEFVSNWYFNFGPNTPNTTLPPLEFAQTPTQAPTATVGTGVNAFKAGSDGYYDIKFSFPTNSQDRFTSGKEAKFTIIGTGITADSFRFLSSSSAFPYLAAAHIQGISNSGGSWVSFSQVPIPPSFILLGSGLLGMIMIGFRRKFHNS